MMDAMEHPDFQPLDEDAVRRGLADDVAGRVAGIEIVERTASTNDRLLYETEAPAAGFRVCLAESQTAGKGRRGGKVWHSPKSGNLYLSVLHCSPVAPARRSAWLGLTAAAEVAAALVAECGVGGVGVKWPNDVYCNGAKLGGVLVESKGGRSVVGVGLNVHLPAGSRPASDVAWVALDEIHRGELDRQRLASAMIAAVVRAFDRAASGIEALMENWRRYDLLMGREVVVLAGDEALPGVARGVDEHGGLRVEHNSEGGGGVRVHYSGDVSIRW